MDKLSGQKQESTKDQPSKNISVDSRVQNAIQKLQGSTGISLQNLKKYLRDLLITIFTIFISSLSAVMSMFFSLQRIDKGVLAREDANYKIRAAARRRRSKSKGGRSRSRRKSSGRKRRRSKSKGKRGSRRRRKAAAADE